MSDKKIVGPRITIHKSCFSCLACRSESYRVQSDSGHDVYCDHPKIEGRFIGDTTWDTPDWCPVLADDPQSATPPQQGED